MRFLKLRFSSTYFPEDLLAIELLQTLVYGRRLSGGFPTRFSFVHPVDELHLSEHTGQLTKAA